MHFDTQRCLRQIHSIGLAIGLFCPTGSPARAATHFLDNGLIRVGVSDTIGGAIEYFAEGNGPGSPGKYYINRHDTGRLVQYAYYCDPITSGGSNPIYDSWFWKPIQGGDVLNNPSDVLYLTNDGVDHSFWREQEVPAVYVTTDLEHFKTYKGTSPFTGGAVTEEQIDQLANNQVDFVRPTKYWAAWIDSNDYGVGIFTQDVQHHVAFRAGAQGVSGEFAPATNYLAPAPKFTVGPNMVDASVSYLVLDTISGIRNLAESKAVNPSVGRWDFNEDNNRQRWGVKNVNDLEVASGSWALNSSAGDPMLLSPQFQVPATDYTQVKVRVSASNAPDTVGQLFWNRLADDPLSFSGSRQKSFTIIPDGQMHTYTFGLATQPGWDGTITQLRLDPTGNGSNTNYAIDYVRLFDPSYVPPPERIDLNTLNRVGSTLGNGGANDGYVSTLGGGGQNTLTTTDVGSNGTLGIGDPFQNGLIVKQNARDAWQLGFGVSSGATRALGDADGDGDVDDHDFLIWQRDFDPTSATNSAFQMLEPSMGLSAMAMLSLSAVSPVRRSQRGSY